MFTISELYDQNLLRNPTDELHHTHKSDNFGFYFFRLGVHRPGGPSLLGQHGHNLEVGSHRRYDFTGILQNIDNHSFYPKSA